MSLAGSISIAVGPSTKGFWTKFNADVKKNPPKVEVKVNPDLTRLRNEINAERKRQELNAVNLKVKLDQSSIRGVENQLKRVEHVWKGSAWSKAVKVNLYVAGAASLPSLISGLMSLTTAVTQLGRAALVLPGIFSGLAVSVGAFSTGIVGVAEAIKHEKCLSYFGAVIMPPEAAVDACKEQKLGNYYVQRKWNVNKIIRLPVGI